MYRDRVVLLGDLSKECSSLDPVAAEFGWSVECVPNLGSFSRLPGKRHLVAVLIEAKELRGFWEQVVQSVHKTAPEVPVIACRRFSDTTHWLELAAAGAFHQLRLPLDPREMRQGLGFVWAVRNSELKRRRLAS